MQSKYCPKCGVELVENASFCYSCGAKLKDYPNVQNQGFNSSENTKKEKDTGLLIFAIIDLLIAIKIPITGFVSYVLLIFTGQIYDPSFLGNSKGAELQTRAMRSWGSSGEILPEYFFGLFVAIILFLMLFHFLTVYSFYKQKKLGWLIGWIRPVVPLILFFILYSILVIENISSDLLLPISIITIPSFIFGIIVIIYFFFRKTKLKELLVDKEN